MKSLKFLSILTLPLVVYFSFTRKEVWLVFLPVLVFFVFLPLIEIVLKPTPENLNKEQELKEKNDKLYTYILYMTIPIQLFFLGYFFKIISEDLTTTILIGRIFSMGLLCGIIGLNVGHELGHRNNRLDEFLGEILLLTSLNTHFLPYHNGGHHFNVATPNDAATARKNEVLYFFWIRSHFMSYIQAWHI